MKTVDRLNEDWLLATEIHKLEARLWRKTRRERIQIVLITSAARGEGKSTTVAYLSTALGLHPDRKILAVDLDLREPRLNSYFGLDISRGLGAVLRGDCRPEDAILRTGLPSLHLLLPSPDGEDPDLLLRASAVNGIFESARRSYDLILVDSPALIPVADAAAILPFVDGVILMAMAGKTTRPQLSRAREICKGMEANILGLIVGNLQEAVSGYGDAGYHYGYGKGKASSNTNGTETLRG